MNRKGFTLVELLAVIVILAIIIVIAVPKIMNVIEGAKRGAFENSVNLIVSSARNYYSKSMLDGGIEDEIVFTQNNGELVNGESKLEFVGMEVAGESYLKLNSAGNVELRITDGVYYASKEFNEIGVVVTEDEGSALTREELSERLAELEEIVSNNTTSINGINTTIQSNSTSVSNQFTALQSIVSSQGTAFNTLNTAIGSVSTSAEFSSTTAAPTIRNKLCQITLTPGTYSLYGWIRVVPPSAFAVSCGFSGANLGGLTTAVATGNVAHHCSVSDYAVVTSTKTISFDGFVVSNTPVTVCEIRALRIK